MDTITSSELLAALISVITIWLGMWLLAYVSPTKIRVRKYRKYRNTLLDPGRFCE